LSKPVFLSRVSGRPTFKIFAPVFFFTFTLFSSRGSCRARIIADCDRLGGLALQGRQIDTRTLNCNREPVVVMRFQECAHQRKRGTDDEHCGEEDFLLLCIEPVLLEEAFYCFQGGKITLVHSCSKTKFLHGFLGVKPKGLPMGSGAT
jgi:hypothetical protein